MWPLNSRRSARTVLKRWIAFNSVGTAGVAVQVATLGMLSGWLGLDYRLATVAAVESAVLHNFAWHHRWTWADRGHRRPDSLEPTRSAKTLRVRSRGWDPASTERCRARQIERRLRDGLLSRLLRFNLTTGLVSILGNLAVMQILVGVLHVHYLVANVLAIGLCSGTNFLVSDRWVFKSRRQESGDGRRRDRLYATTNDRFHPNRLVALDRRNIQDPGLARNFVPSPKGLGYRSSAFQSPNQ